MAGGGYGFGMRPMGGRMMQPMGGGVPSAPPMVSDPAMMGGGQAANAMNAYMGGQAPQRPPMYQPFGMQSFGGFNQFGGFAPYSAPSPFLPQGMSSSGQFMRPAMFNWPYQGGFQGLQSDINTLQKGYLGGGIGGGIGGGGAAGGGANPPTPWAPGQATTKPAAAAPANTAAAQAVTDPLYVAATRYGNNASEYIDPATGAYKPLGRKRLREDVYQGDTSYEDWNNLGFYGD